MSKLTANVVVENREVKESAKPPSRTVALMGAQFLQTITVSYLDVHKTGTYWYTASDSLIQMCFSSREASLAICYPSSMAQRRTYQYAHLHPAHGHIPCL